MKTIIFNNKKTIQCCDETLCYPSNSANVRNYIEVWLPESAMTFEEFEALCKDESLTANIKIQTKGEGNPESSFDLYDYPTEIGKKEYEIHDFSAGTTTKEMRLFARLEQLTYIERKLKELGLLETQK